MNRDGFFADADKVLAAMDFQAETAEREAKHQREVAHLLVQFLEVLDSLQALEDHCETLVDSGQKDVPHKSVNVLRRKMLQVFAEAGVTPLDTVGQQLDLRKHEVVATRLDLECNEDTIVEEMLPGYLWNKQVLRPAKVIVGSPSVRSTENTEGNTP